nr:MAG TPA: Reovirus outer capsid protein, Sigma 3 [Caudoviricetes sp.]DAS37406.1 MAG TPA: Reovirus outer capsid protein, Sigma 3 [Caudoviricetes sp.]
MKCCTQCCTLYFAVVETRKNIIYNHHRTYIDDLWALCLI